MGSLLVTIIEPIQARWRKNERDWQNRGNCPQYLEIPVRGKVIYEDRFEYGKAKQEGLIVGSNQGGEKRKFKRVGIEDEECLPFFETAHLADEFAGKERRKESYED